MASSKSMLKIGMITKNLTMILLTKTYNITSKRSAMPMILISINYCCKKRTRLSNNCKTL